MQVFSQGDGVKFELVKEKLKAQGVTLHKSEGSIRHASGECEEVWFFERILSDGTQLEAAVCPMGDEDELERTPLRSICERLRIDMHLAFGWVFV